MLRKDDMKNILRFILRPSYYFIKDLSPYSKRLLARNSKLENKYHKQRGFLLLSGESLNRIDISKLKGEYTAGCGFLFLDRNAVNLPLSFIIATEPGPIMDKLNAPGWYNWPEELLPSYGRNQGYIYLKNIKEHFTDKGTITFLDANKTAYYKKIKLFNFNEPNVYYVKSNPYLFTKKTPRLDLTKRFNGGDGSAFNIILIMIYMGFKEIYLAGAGYSYEPVYEYHFYDNFVFSKDMKRQKAILEAKKAIDTRNKAGGSTVEYYGLFEKDNFYRGVYIQRLSHEFHKEKHRILNNYATARGVKIYNIVPDGFESPIYGKITWPEVESNILCK
jgi:hypothetical protein